ncbi:hypothetical protein QTI66_34225 [Variovorax sp. J22R133]|uniref:hypothetical protein n=1 Tax=Variovorax brevis TaxID=3053503 RepID=UPI0025780D18|nr:hypothetical protein [Variovorax sp. J22R133]MDM0117182.1 hypothetical protein [Variovorax sp. J22R133]
MTTLTIGAVPGRVRLLFPGVLACGVVAAASTFLSEHYGAPVMLFALLLGIAMNFLSGEGGTCKPGIELAGRTLLPLSTASLCYFFGPPSGIASVTHAFQPLGRFCASNS